MPGGLVIEHDAVLFHGLCLEEEIDFGGGLAISPFERTQAFVDEEVCRTLRASDQGARGSKGGLLGNEGGLYASVPA